MFCLDHFKELNPAWVNVRVVMSDKDFTEKDVLAEAFPDAQQLLCQFHVIDYLRKKVGRLSCVASDKKKEIVAALQLMMKAESAQAYNAYRDDMLRSLGGNKEDPFFQYFEANWENCKAEWVDYHRDNLPHLNNHTNNRIESGWGKIKQLVDREDAIDELISQLIMLQEWAEEKYMKEFKSLRTRQTPDAADALDSELRTLAVQLSPHAYRLVRDQYKFAVEADGIYTVKIDGPKAELHRQSDGEPALHVLNIKTFQCSCKFMNTLLLPCRHVIFFRLSEGYESAIPPPKFYTSRWSLFSPENDISSGRVDVGGSLRTHNRHKNLNRAPTRDEKYIEARAVCQQIQGLMADQSAETFNSTFTLLKTVEEFCRLGDVRKLADAVSVLGDHDRERKPKKSRKKDSEEPKHGSAEQEHPITTQVKFSPAPKRTQAARRKQNKAKKAQSLNSVRRRAKLLARGQTKTLPQLAEVGLLLSQQYCFAYAAKMVELLPMKQVDVRRPHTVQRMNVGQELPGPTSILPSETCAAAIADIHLKTAAEASNTVYLVRWDEFGYATLEQLTHMLLVHEARQSMPKVEATLQWIDAMPMPSSGVSAPFDDCVKFTKLLFKDTVENMTLNKYVMTGEEIEGVRLLEFRATQWLSSTCVRAGLIMLARRYVTQDVGFFTPDWYPFTDLPRQQKAAATHGAFHANIQRQIGVVNTGGYHWMAFYVDLTSEEITCTMFDPQQTDSRYTTLEVILKNVIVAQLRGHPSVKFMRWTETKQEDGHSCGVWRLFFLESMISGHKWTNAYYDLSSIIVSVISVCVRRILRK